jgi:ATP-dependent DNA ligase
VFLQFIEPCSPVPTKTVPVGDDWQHEIKFDGFRSQLHKVGSNVALYSELASITDVIEAYETVRWPNGKVDGSKG